MGLYLLTSKNYGKKIQFLLETPLIYHSLQLLGTFCPLSNACICTICTSNYQMHVYAPLSQPFGNSHSSETSSSLPNDQLAD